MPLDGMQIGRYHFIRMLGSGGMGEVYLAEDARIGQQVAIKVMRSETTPYPNANATQEASRLFQREAMAIARLDHPHILPLYDYGEVSINGTTLTYLVMPFRQEGSLVDWLQRRGSSALLLPQDVAHIVSQIADALQHAHDRGIIHQDVKPSNLLIRERKETANRPDVLLADFGIAKSTTATASTSQVIRGTPTYMAPEQWEAHPVPATDQYALAVMAYELLTGRPPFQGGTVQMMYQHLNAQPEPPSKFKMHISSDVDAVLLHALAKKPTDRFASISAFANAFQQAVQSADASSSVKVPGISNTASMPMAIGIQSERESANKLIEPTPVLLPSPDQTPGVTLPAKQRTDEPRVAGAGASGGAGGTGKPGRSPGSGDTIPGVLTKGIPRRRTGRRWLAVALVALVLVLVSGGIASATPGGLTRLIGGIFGGGATATVTITPMSQDLKKSYMISAVTGTPNASNHQVQARQLSYTTPSQSQTANATGTRQVPAVRATGQLLVFTNIGATISTGTIFTGNSGVQVATDADVNIPIDAGNKQIFIAAHAVNAGSSGNIPPGDINQGSNYVFSCPIGSGASSNIMASNLHQSDSTSRFLDAEVPLSGGTTVICNPRAFTGGHDLQTYTIVQRSDIDGAANPLVTSLTQSAQQSLQGMVRANERLLADPQCRPNVTYDHAAGDRATSVTVSVTVTCTGEAYDQDGALAMATQWLKQDASQDPGAGYALVGKELTAVTQATMADAKSGTIAVSVSAEGVWVYQFSAAQEQALAKLIAGKSKAEALSLLSQQPGVAKVDIQLAGGNANTFPSDSSQIKFVVLSVEGK